MEQLTTKQNEILNYIKKYISIHDFPPTVREIAKKINVSSSATVYEHLNKLQKKGYIKKDTKKNRSIELLIFNEFKAKNEGIIRIPYLRDITFKNYKLLLKNPKEYIYVSSLLISKNKDIFAIKINNDDINNKNILNNDIIIFQKQNNLINDDIIIIISENSEILLKTYYKENDKVKLKFENKYVILGKVVSLVRKNIN